MAKPVTELALRRRKPPRYRVPFPDGAVPGLRWRHNLDGTFTADLRPRIDGRQVPIIVGRYPQVGLAEVRKRAWQIKEDLCQGIDPRRRNPEPERHTVRLVTAKFVEKRIKPRARRWREVEAMLERDVIAAWGHRPIRSIAKRDVRDLLEAVVERGAPVVANRVHALIRQLFEWAIREDYVAINPAAGVDRPFKEQPRQRSLTENEIRLVWRAFEDMGAPYGKLGMLLLLLGARRGEVAGMRWSQLGLERGLWRLPSTSTKTSVERMVPLVPTVVEILASIPRIDGRDPVFPASRGDNTIGGFSQALRALHRSSGTTGWHWHDLRRTVRTNLARLGVPQHIGERVLGHASGGESAISRVYNTYRYEAEVREAMQLWASELDRIVTRGEPKVVAIAGARA
jgi:integrase